eukprot:1969857-Amphidinium_carterae.1
MQLIQQEGCSSKDLSFVGALFEGLSTTLAARPIQPSSDSLSAPEGAQPMETDGMEEQVEPPKCGVVGDDDHSVVKLILVLAQAHAPPAESASSLGPREGQSQPAPAPKVPVMCPVGHKLDTKLKKRLGP